MSPIAPEDERFISFTLCREVLQMRCSSFWFGKVTAVVHENHGTPCSRDEIMGITRVGLLGRILDCTKSVWDSITIESLQKRNEINLCAAKKPWVEATSVERRMGRSEGDRASRCCHGVRPDEFFCGRENSKEDTALGGITSQRGQVGEQVGIKEGLRVLLRLLCLLDVRNAMGEVLKSFFVLGPCLISTEELQGKLSSFPSIRKRTQVLARSYEEKPYWPLNCTTNPQGSLHTVDADVGYGGTLNTIDMSAGVQGMWSDQGIWSWKDRAQSISIGELKEIWLLLTECMGKQVKTERCRNLLLHMDKKSVVHITNRLVSANRPMMIEMRRLKLVPDRMGTKLCSEWITSVANRFTDGLLRRFPRGGLKSRKSLRLVPPRLEGRRQ